MLVEFNSFTELSFVQWSGASLVEIKTFTGEKTLTLHAFLYAGNSI
jgi:hypothetical protein